MSLPIDPVLNSSRGKYNLSAQSASSRRSNRFGNNMAVRDEGPEMPPSGGKAQQQMNRFRDFVGRSCCSCVERMPAIVLIISICLLVAILLALIPAVFLLTNAVASESQAHVSRGVEVKGVRGGFSFPSSEDSEEPDETFNDDVTMHGISVSALLPANVSICQGFGFACTNQPHIVISTNKRCDGLSDCPDGSDEKNCVECQTSFSCALHPNISSSSATICLRSKHLCDSVKHCPDGSDETTHCRDSCEDHELKCSSRHGSSMCLPSIAVCDGVEDCADGEDERDCQQCGRGARLCESSGICVEARLVCDGTKQCSGGEDEQDCDCRSCSDSSLALCDDGTCLDRQRICDGRIDCADGMDETDCPGQCEQQNDDAPQSESVTCSDGRDYLKREACSGQLEQCQMACDECDSLLAFTCSIDKKCIPRAAMCDGSSDCEDGEDEKDCGCDVEAGDFKCLSSDKCVTSDLRCDGVLDCSDASDEADCEQCPSSAIRCELDSSCRPSATRCDGVPDCSDGQDETDCTCHECTGLHSWTYMCEESHRCFRRSEVCSPYSLCPNATLNDKVFCAGVALNMHF